MGCQCQNESETFKELDQFISDNNCTSEASLIQVLHHAQHLFGYLPRNVQIHVAKKLNVAVAKVYGVISFYSFFTDKARGKNIIQVCLGTGCFVKGADKVMEIFEQELNIKAGQTTEDMNFTLSGVRCVGACGLAPVVIINDKVYGHVKPGQVMEILQNYLIDEAKANA